MNTKGEKGFSLIELLVTIALAAILSAIAILYAPGMMDNYKVRGATRLVYGDMQMARLRAIKEGKEFAVEFITGNTTTYCVKRKATGAANWDAGCNGGTDTVDEIIKTVALASEYSGIAVDPANLTDINDTANERAAFYPDGRASTSGSITISKGSRNQDLCILSGTGRIRTC